MQYKVICLYYSGYTNPIEAKERHKQRRRYDWPSCYLSAMLRAACVASFSSNEQHIWTSSSALIIKGCRLLVHTLIVELTYY